MAADQQSGSVPDAADESVPGGPPPAGAPATQVGTPPAPADPGAIPSPPAILAGTADRERTIDVLKAAFAEGRLTLAEHGERVDQVHAARTCVELAGLVADLPAGPSAVAIPSPVVPHPPPVPPMINSLAAASLICGLAEIPTLGLSAVPAIILGSKARKQIRETGERGEGLAVAGLILGWIVVGSFFAAVAGIMIWLMLPPGASGPIGS